MRNRRFLTVIVTVFVMLCVGHNSETYAVQVGTGSEINDAENDYETEKKEEESENKKYKTKKIKRKTLFPLLKEQLKEFEKDMYSAENVMVFVDEAYFKIMDTLEVELIAISDDITSCKVGIEQRKQQVKEDQTITKSEQKKQIRKLNTAQKEILLNLRDVRKEITRLIKECEADYIMTIKTIERNY